MNKKTKSWTISFIFTAWMLSIVLGAMRLDRLRIECEMLLKEIKAESAKLTPVMETLEPSDLEGTCNR